VVPYLLIQFGAPPVQPGVAGMLAFWVGGGASSAVAVEPDPGAGGGHRGKLYPRRRLRKQEDDDEGVERLQEAIAPKPALPVILPDLPPPSPPSPPTAQATLVPDDRLDTAVADLKKAIEDDEEEMLLLLLSNL